MIWKFRRNIRGKVLEFVSERWPLDEHSTLCFVASKANAERVHGLQAMFEGFPWLPLKVPSGFRQGSLRTLYRSLRLYQAQENGTIISSCLVP